MNFVICISKKPEIVSKAKETMQHLYGVESSVNTNIDFEDSKRV
jgi:hypothetical protein